MSIDALVKHVGKVLNRAHALFGQPGSGGGVAAGHSGSTLAGAAELVGHGHRRMAGLSGALPATYGTFATDAAPGLGRVSTADNRLGTQIHDAVQVDWTGRTNSGSVVNGAAADTAALAPVSGTPAGQRALIATLRARLAQQQHLVNEYTVRDARLATLLRSLSYGRGRAAGGCLRNAVWRRRRGPWWRWRRRWWGVEWSGSIHQPGRRTRPRIGFWVWDGRGAAAAGTGGRDPTWCADA